jgi:hypothetical protein
VPRELRAERDSREVVVAERGVADVAREQDLVGGLAAQYALAVRQAPLGERAVDADLVLSVGQVGEARVLEAEAPALLVVGRPVRNPARALGQRVQMGPQLGERHPPVDGHAVLDDVEVRAPEVDDTLAACVLHPRVADAPLARDGPVEDARAGRDLVARERHVLRDAVERRPEACPGDAPAERVELLDELVHLAAGCREVDAAAEVGDPHAHRLRKSGYVRSRSAIIVTGSGHAMSKAGSSQRTPAP